MMTNSSQAEFAGMPRRLYLASPSKLGTFLDCPRQYRMAYLQRPMPAKRAPRAHTMIGVATHNALRDFWDLAPAQRTPAGVTELMQSSWISTGFKSAEHSNTWRHKITAEVIEYLRGIDRQNQPPGIERTVAYRTDSTALTGRIDRLDDRDGELVVVDYKTSRRPLHPDSARMSLAMAIYALAVERMFHRECVEVELHHVPTGEVVSHRHTAQSLQRRLAEAESIASDLRRADADFAEKGSESTQFPPNPSPLCRWCDFRQHCPEGQLMGPEHSNWAALENEES